MKRRSLFAQLFQSFLESGTAYAASKGSVRVEGTTIQAVPVGGGRFMLVGVPEGVLTVHFTTPDGVAGTFTVNFPDGGFLDLGTVTVRRNGRVEFDPPLSPALLPSVIKARGAVSNLASSASALPAPGACSTTFTVTGLTFCFDQSTWFDPPLSSANPLANGQNVQVVGVPTSDPTSKVFRALRVQQNSGFPAAVQNTVRVEAPIAGFGVGSITVFGGTSDAPNAHALTFTTAQADFEPPPMQNRLALGLLVDVTGGPVSADPSTGSQTSAATRVKLEKVPVGLIRLGKVLDLQGTISSIQPQAKTVGLNNESFFVQALDTTRFEDPLVSFDSLQIGQVVEVRGFASTSPGGPVQAITVELEGRTGSMAIMAQGPVASLDSTQKTFVVDGIQFCYDCNGATTIFLEGTAQSLANGQFVEVRGTALRSNVSTALQIELETTPVFSSTSDKGGRDDET